MVDLDQTCYEELLLLVGLSLPVVRLSKRNEKAHISSPSFVVGIGRRACVGFDGSEVVQIPRLSDRERAVHVLL